MSVLEKIVILKLNDKRKSPVLPEILKSEVVKRIGSEFKSGTRDCIRGLNPVQERVLLPPILGLQPGDAQFPQRSRDYWADFSIIPTVEGIKLNIATETSSISVNGKEESYELPVSTEDYMIYQIARQSSKVASSPEELENLSEFDFLLIDLSEQKEREESEYQTKKDATLAFAQLVANSDKNTEKINWIIQMLKQEEEFFDFDSSSIDKEIFLNKLLDKDPSKFIKITSDPNLETKALLKRALALKQISLEGDNFFLGDTNIGPIRSAVEWLKNPENSSKVVALKSRLENVSKTTKQ